MYSFYKEMQEESNESNEAPKIISIEAGEMTMKYKNASMP